MRATPMTPPPPSTQASNEEWVRFDAGEAAGRFSSQELLSLPAPGKDAVCGLGLDNLPDHCCIGSASMAGFVYWEERGCSGVDFLRALAPRGGESSISHTDSHHPVSGVSSRVIHGDGVQREAKPCLVISRSH
jgi:hypothetical protein